MGKSAFGPGIKAGGPNYVVPLMKFDQSASNEQMASDVQADRAPELPGLSALWQSLHRDSNEASVQLRKHLTTKQWQQLLSAILDYDQFATTEIRRQHDSMRLVGQDNFRQYQPMTHIRIRVAETDNWLEILARAAAVMAVGGRATISHSPGVHEKGIGLLEQLTAEWAADMEFIQESEQDLAEAILSGQVDRLRYASGVTVPEGIRKAADERFVYVATDPVSYHGRVELLWYVREQSLCVDYHRYGNLGFRAEEKRRPVH
jgi:RHH-type proline utilization regulon transcriptional repressor/proline dehydrogenase/delta 1-pyrroline-5-carboxylate dehydrogenase